MAAYCVILAGNRAPTFEEERHFLYRLPLARGRQYIHAIAVANGAKCERPGETESMDDLIKRARKQLDEHMGRPRISSQP